MAGRDDRRGSLADDVGYIIGTSVSVVVLVQAGLSAALAWAVPVGGLEAGPEEYAQFVVLYWGDSYRCCADQPYLPRANPRGEDKSSTEHADHTCVQLVGELCESLWGAVSRWNGYRAWGRVNSSGRRS